MRSKTVGDKFSDFSLTFRPHPNTGDISRLTNEVAIKQAIKNLVLTGFSERRFDPGKGCGVYHLLFEQICPPVSDAIREHIETVLTNYEPRIDVKDIITNPNYDLNGYDVTITYEIINQEYIMSVGLFLEMIT